MQVYEGLRRFGRIPPHRLKLNNPKLDSCTDLKTESSHYPKLGFHSHTSKLRFDGHSPILSACLLLIQLQGYRKISGKLKPLNPILVSVACRPDSITIRYPVIQPTQIWVRCQDKQKGIPPETPFTPLSLDRYIVILPAVLSAPLRAAVSLQGVLCKIVLPAVRTHL